MRAFARSWPALFAWGAGLLHLALAGEILSEGAATPAVVVVVALAVQASGEATWGIASLHAGDAVARRVAAGGAVTGVVVAGAAIAAGGSVIAAAVTIALVVASAALVSSRRRAPAGRPRPWIAAAGIAAGAILVAGLVTPAASTTRPASYGEHGTVVSYDPHAGH